MLTEFVEIGLDSEPPVLYCQACGAQLQLTWGKVTYDTASGQPWYRDAHYKCPNGRWWQFFRGVMHSETTVMVPTEAQRKANVPPIEHMESP